MTEEKTKEPTFECAVSFEKPKKEIIAQRYSQFITLIEENKETLHSKVTISKEKKRVLLDAKDFVLTIRFDDRVSVRIVVHDPYVNRIVAGEIGSKIINYLSTVLGEDATEGVVGSTLVSFSPKTSGLASKLLGEGRMARINELAEQPLRPFSIAFDFTIGDKDFMFIEIADKETTLMLSSRTIYKDKIPFNFLEKEIADLDIPATIAKKLTKSIV